MPGVKRIGEYAFYQSGLTTITAAPLIENIGDYAFDETPWIATNRTNGFVILNNNLIKYVDVPGVTDVTVPVGVTRIITKAFKGSSLHSLHISAGVEYIERRALEDCVNIEKVEFCGQSTPVVDGLLTDGTGRTGESGNQLKIYVPYAYHELYERNLFYLNRYNGPFEYVYKINYHDITDPTYYVTEKYIAEDLPLTINHAAPRSDLTFAGWSNNSSTFNNVTTITAATQDVDVYAFYTYPVTFIFDNGDPAVSLQVVYHDYFSFPARPTMEGYYLSGWSISEGGYESGYFQDNVTSSQLDNNLSLAAGWIITALWAPNRYQLKVEEGTGWYIYLDENSHPLLSGDEQWVNFGDEICVAELVAAFKSHGLGFVPGKTLVGFDFEEPPSPSSSSGGPNNAAPPDSSWQLPSSITVPYLGENGSIATFKKAEEEPQNSNNAASTMGLQATNAAPNGDLYYLYPVYNFEKYYIIFKVGGEPQNNLENFYTYGDLLPSFGDYSGYISNLHCDFIGWATSAVSSLAPSASAPSDYYNTSRVYDFTFGEDLELDYDNALTLYAIVRRRCEVTFKNYNGTVLKTEYVSYGGNATPPNNPTREGYVFGGWDKECTHVTVEFLVCTATYIRKVIIVNNYSGTMTINDYRAVYVDCSNPTNGAVYKIGSYVNDITFEIRPNSNSNVKHKQRIEVLSRSGPINITLINYVGEAWDNNPGIYGQYSTVNLNCKGYNSITGGENITSQRLAAGIYVKTLNITGECYDGSIQLWVTGGKGKDGENGADRASPAEANSFGHFGGYGDVGNKGGFGIVCKNLSISNIAAIITGGDGGNGGNGGYGQQGGKRTTVPGNGVVGYTGTDGGDGGFGGCGGQGGDALELLSGGTLYVSKANTYAGFFGGNGGNGGNGGHGGKGGTGGEGGPGAFLKAAAKGGKGGKGGDGGDGGSGGYAGGGIKHDNATLDISLVNCHFSNGIWGNGGIGGEAGEGGNGGIGGSKWRSDNRAAPGDPGDPGAPGAPGE